MPRKPLEPIEFSVTALFYGLPAYYIDNLLKSGLYGHNRAEVVRNLVSEYIVKYVMRGGLEEALGSSGADAERKGYIPVKIKKEPAFNHEKRRKR